LGNHILQEFTGTG